MKTIDLKHGENEITLLSAEEYKRYKNVIPKINGWIREIRDTLRQWNVGEQK